MVSRGVALAYCQPSTENSVLRQNGHFQKKCTQRIHVCSNHDVNRKRVDSTVTMRARPTTDQATNFTNRAITSVPPCISKSGVNRFVQ